MRSAEAGQVVERVNWRRRVSKQIFWGFLFFTWQPRWDGMHWLIISGLCETSQEVELWNIQVLRFVIYWEIKTMHHCFLVSLLCVLLVLCSVLCCAVLCAVLYCTGLDWTRLDWGGAGDYCLFLVSRRKLVWGRCMGSLLCRWNPSHVQAWDAWASNRRGSSVENGRSRFLLHFTSCI